MKSSLPSPSFKVADYNPMDLFTVNEGAGKNIHKTTNRQNTRNNER